VISKKKKKEKKKKLVAAPFIIEMVSLEDACRKNMTLNPPVSVWRGQDELPSATSTDDNHVTSSQSGFLFFISILRGPQHQPVVCTN